MITAEKPELNEDLLAHFGVKGMHWGQRKPEDASTGRTPSVQRPNYPRRAPLTGRQPHKLSDHQKMAVKISVGIGLAAAGYFLARRGMTPSAAAMSDKSTKTGFKAAFKTMRVIGKISVKTAPKAVKVTSKVGLKTATITGKLTGKAVAKVGTTSFNQVVQKGARAGKAIADSYKKMQLQRALRNSPQALSTGARIAESMLSRVGLQRIRRGGNG